MCTSRNRPTRISGFRISGFLGFRFFGLAPAACCCCHALITDLNGHCKPNSGCEKYLKHLIISVPAFRIFQHLLTLRLKVMTETQYKVTDLQGLHFEVSSALACFQQKICTASSRETDGDAFRSSPARASEASGLRCNRGTLVVSWKLHICNRLI